MIYLYSDGFIECRQLQDDVVVVGDQVKIIRILSFIFLSQIIFLCHKHDEKKFTYYDGTMTILNARTNEWQTVISMMIDFEIDNL